jgi:hypothetical protein
VDKGLPPDWDIRPILLEMSSHAGRLLPVLEQIDARSWIARGASETYAAQLQSSKEQARAIEGAAKALAANPEKLSAGLELYFRVHGLDNQLRSLEDGLRRYQNPAAAEMLAGLAAENGANRERFQSYIVALTAEREQQFAVMDAEAQRCRGILARQQPVIPGNSGRKK